MKYTKNYMWITILKEDCYIVIFRKYLRKYIILNENLGTYNEEKYKTFVLNVNIEDLVAK